MGYRFLSSVAAVSAVMTVASAPLGGQTHLAAAKTWTPPRTPDGQPDLQGIWTNFNNVPLQRSKDLGAKEFYTEREAADIAKRGFQGDRGARPQATYNQAQFGLDSAQQPVVPNLRTSLVVVLEGRL